MDKSLTKHKRLTTMQSVSESRKNEHLQNFIVRYRLKNENLQNHRKWTCKSEHMQNLSFLQEEQDTGLIDRYFCILLPDIGKKRLQTRFHLLDYLRYGKKRRKA